MTVTSATRRPDGNCDLKLHVAAGATGDRDLVVKRGRHTTTYEGVVRLSCT